MKDIKLNPDMLHKLMELHIKTIRHGNEQYNVEHCKMVSLLETAERMIPQYFAQGRENLIMTVDTYHTFGRSLGITTFNLPDWK